MAHRWAPWSCGWLTGGSPTCGRTTRSSACFSDSRRRSATVTRHTGVGRGSLARVTPWLGARSVEGPRGRGRSVRALLLRRDGWCVGLVIGSAGGASAAGTARGRRRRRRCGRGARGRSRRALLALLGLRAGEVVSAGRIVEELWGDQEIRDPLNAVQVLVSKLRRALGTAVRSDGRQLIATTGVGLSPRRRPGGGRRGPLRSARRPRVAGCWATGRPRRRRRRCGRR